MIRVTVINNTDRQVITIPKETSISEAFEMCGVDYSTGYKTIDGAALNPGEVNKSFEELGYATGSSCRLVNVVKADNANILGLI